MADKGEDEPKTKRKRPSRTERREARRKYHAVFEKKQRNYFAQQIQRLSHLLPFDRPERLNLPYICVLEESHDFIMKLLEEQKELKTKFEEQKIRDEADELRALERKVSESEKEKKRLESLLNEKKEMGVQCTNTRGEEEGEDRIDFNPPPNLINWEPLNYSLTTFPVTIATTTTATTNHYSDGMDLRTSPFMFQSCQYQDFQQTPRQTHSYQPSSFDSLSANQPSSFESLMGNQSVQPHNISKIIGSGRGRDQ